MSTSSKNNLSYAIFYGFVGGPAHSKKLRRQLDDSGLSLASGTENADILIAHSAGCWEIPKKNSAKLIILVGMPLANNQPRKMLFKVNYLTWRTAVQHHKFLSSLSGILFKNLFYAIRQPKRNYRIARGSGVKRKLVEYPNAKVLFVVNEHDLWPRVTNLEDLLRSRHYILINMPGAHDDIWENSDNYTKLVLDNV